MALTIEEKQKLIAEYHIHDSDTGSADVQIALLTTRIKQFTEHLRIQQERSILTPWSAANGWEATAVAGLPAPDRFRPLHSHHRKVEHPHPVRQT